MVATYICLVQVLSMTAMKYYKAFEHENNIIFSSIAVACCPQCCRMHLNFHTSLTSCNQYWLSLLLGVFCHCHKSLWCESCRPFSTNLFMLPCNNNVGAARQTRTIYSRRPRKFYRASSARKNSTRRTTKIMSGRL